MWFYFLNISETDLLIIIIDYIFGFFVIFTNILLNNNYLPEFNYIEKHRLKITGNLEEVMIAFCLIGQFWKSDYGQVKFEDSEEFLEFEKFDYVKLIFYFNINQININSYHVTTEIRVLCLGEKALISFRPY